MTDQLVRPQADRRIAGVAGALANRYGWDVSMVRIMMVLSVLLPGPQVIGYLLGWVLIPEEPKLMAPPTSPSVTPGSTL